MDKTDLLTARETAAHLGLTVSQVGRLAARGELGTAIKAPGLRGARLFDPAEVDRFADERKAGAK